MLAIISDLHFQHTADDSIRFRKDGELHEIGVARNVGASALDRFFAMVRERAERHAAHDVELVFAGDVFELHRSPIWFYGGSGVRPWRVPESQADAPPARLYWGEDDESNPLRRTLCRVLDAVEREGAENWRVLAEFVRTMNERGIPVRVHFIPGNHDRLVNAWPSTRRRVRKLLSMDPADDSPFPCKLAWSRDAGYGVLVRHGHEYDRDNFPCEVAAGKALDLTIDDYLPACLGDYISLEVAARLAIALRARCAVELRSEHGGDFRELYFALTEFDDVRPQSLLKKYLLNRASAEDRAIGHLQALMEDMSAAAKWDPFFRRSVPLPARILVKLLSPWMISLLARLWLFDDRRPAAPAMFAQFEPDLIRGDVDLVIAGHTHNTHQAPLPTLGDEDQPFFIDSGTWRTIIHGLDFRPNRTWQAYVRNLLRYRKDPLLLLRELDPRRRTCFSPIRAYTMIFCYHETERDANDADGRRIEVWSGHLAPVELRHGTTPHLGRYDLHVARRKQPAKAMQLAFTRLAVRSLPGRKSHLRLEFGVDDQRRIFDQRKVRRGAEIDLTQAVPRIEPIPLDPELDGELWAHGVKVNLVWNAMLPWALDRLPRAADGSFIAKEGELRMAGYGGAEMIIGYMIEQAEAGTGGVGAEFGWVGAGRVLALPALRSKAGQVSCNVSVGQATATAPVAGRQRPAYAIPGLPHK